MINQSKDISWEEFNSAKEARLINLTQPGGRDKDFFYEFMFFIYLNISFKYFI